MKRLQCPASTPSNLIFLSTPNRFFRTLDQLQNGGWGYGADDLDRPQGLPCASIQPGWDLSPPGSPRNGGVLYCNRWCRALVSSPTSVLLSDWNGWNEGTALEESDSWLDGYGQAAPRWYIDLTRGYDLNLAAAA